jgi:hypothetical protein
MEQVEGGDLIVNKGDESRPKDVAKGQPERDLGVVEGFDAAFKLAKVTTVLTITLHHLTSVCVLQGQYRRNDQE